MLVAPVESRAVDATIGFVNVEEAVRAHPDLETVLVQIQQFEDAKIDELSGYGDYTSLTEDQRRQLMNDLARVQDEVDAEKQRLTEPLIQDVIDATTEVGIESGIEVILEAGAVVYGGLPLTPLVIEKLKAL